MKKKNNLALAGALVIAGSAVSVGAALASPAGNVTFCHATNSVKNAYVTITTDPDSIFKQGHDGHNGPVFNNTMTNKDNWGDIIPAFTYTTEDKKTKVVTVHTYPGKNIPAGAAILANGCNLPGPVVSPSPSASASVSPSPSVSASPSVSPSPVVSVSPTASVTPSASSTPTGSASPTPSATATATVSPSASPTKVVTHPTGKPSAKPPVMGPRGHGPITPVAPKGNTPTAGHLPYTGVNTGIYFGFAMIVIGLGMLLVFLPEALRGATLTASR